ncbi:hypothetical protein BDV41DRAFT_588770 [Aspergillus transmontanensis]|uniref:Ketosynthase family 3 (KS3) domain-containing protein n=1 Tax=Aspergillus transmontanensis TaxID=1034304 RepID=A0A5N6W016_9EURO|nr:hypothetical protein BDV41DRAFT_588770 [Aspergillus transmontanensis]
MAMRSNLIMHPSSIRHDENKDRSQLAFRLLIELLAYQLASPVRWIETQHELITCCPPICRFIEVGPRTTLATMAKRSAARHYRSYTNSQWSHLQFLSYQDNKDEVFYNYPDFKVCLDEKEKARSLTSRHVSLLPLLPGSLREPQQCVPPKAPPSRASPSVDVSLSSSHIALAMTAQKLRQPFDKVAMGRTVRELSGGMGKSTLQNELVGDLVAEFGRVPEGVEDMTLNALGEALQGVFAGKPAKHMTSLIARLISRKMPAGFNQNSIQDYICSRWGFSKAHSLVPICLAITIEPTARLANADAAQGYLDELISRYATFQGISLVPADDLYIDQSDVMPSAVGFSDRQIIHEQQRGYYRRHFDILAKYLEIDLGTSGQPPLDITYQETLERWNAEFDDHFSEGIKSMFDIIQARNYDSWWNWAREELIQWLHRVASDPLDVALPRKGNHLRRILNRWDPSCSDIVEAMIKSPRPVGCPKQAISSCSDIRLALKEILRLGDLALGSEPIYIYSFPALCPKTTISSSGELGYMETARKVSSYPDVVCQGRLCADDLKTIIPFVHIKSRRNEGGWKYDADATSILHTALGTGTTTGFSYASKTVLVTGAGPGSIGAQVVQGLLCGGARVVVTTSRTISESASFYQEMYRRYGARGASLTVFPMNQASKRDCEYLIEHMYSADSPIGGDLDYVIPFAAVPQAGELDKLGSRQELAHRAMLVNLLRIVGFIRQQKEKRRISCRPTTIVLPMSCNEGSFGGDGLYAESKAGLKTLLNRFHSESWSSYITICGAVIGWTRGTGLMHSANVIAEEVEKLGVITFTQAEMAFNILALMTPEITTLAEQAPVYADLTGGLGLLRDIKDHISGSRRRLSEESQIRKALQEEDTRHVSVLFGPQQQQPKDPGVNISRRRAHIQIPFPILQSFDDLRVRLPNLKGMIDLSRTVVVVGFSELGPWGNARTRWEMEHQGWFSMEGYIEMAWIMGLIKHVDGDWKGRHYVGWVDAETQEPIHDQDIPHKYHEHIMSNTGLRLIEPEGVDTYIPSQKEFLQEVAVEEDLPPFECSKSSAEAFKLRHGNNITLQPIPGSDSYRVFLKKGAVLMIAKTIPFHQSIAGIVPTGWDALRYGIPEEIIQQVDTTTLYALCCVSEAFLSAGINDPYDIYQHIHVSELANCLGTGGGPMKVIQNMYRDRFLDRQVRGDIILEHFLNTMGAWVNMLLLSASGPLKTPVGACATALESLDIGCDAIISGNCKVAIVGGCDDYREELSFEFDSIKATANCVEELARGRLPSEISRPTTSSRSGFAESAGCGVQLLMNAELALKLGLPIHGIVAYSQMASDQAGRSIPAPGKGILTAAREHHEAKSSPFLDFNFRRAGFDAEVADVEQKSIGGPLGRMQSTGAIRAVAEQSRKLKVQDAQWRWAHNIRLQDSSVSPLRAALATWGLGIDDIGVVSMHGTSTKANDINEGQVINTQMDHLGRRKGNPLLCVCQKSLTGHPKAAAGAWQLNGCMQILQDGIVPGNRNADNIDAQLRQFDHLVYPMESIKTTGIKATMITSFGFGQKGAIAIVVAPSYLFVSLPASMYEEYRVRVTQRQRAANPELVSRILNNCIVQIKSLPPWENRDATEKVFLDPSSCRQDVTTQVTNQAHVGPSESINTTTDRNSQVVENEDEGTSLSCLIEKMLIEAVRRSKGTSSPSVGVDVEEIASINIEDDTFLQRNFTLSEREYCFKAPNPQASFAGRWSAKEAVLKSLHTSSSGPRAPMQEIEVFDYCGVPRITLHGEVKDIAKAKGIGRVEVSISHSSKAAVAIAVAVKG